jgi:hypothetical protein
MDWKAHKRMCPLLKTLSNNLEPFHEAERIIKEILTSTKDTGINDWRVLEHLLLYTELQFGSHQLDPISVGYRERKDGQRINNWEVDSQQIDRHLFGEYFIH